MSRSVKFIALSFSEGLNVLANLLFLPYLSRAMEVNDYGTYGQTILIIEIVKGLAAFGLAKIIFTFLANKNRDQTETFYSNILSAFIIGLIGSLLLILFKPLYLPVLNNNALNSTITIYSLSICLSLMYTSLNATLIFAGLVKKASVISIITNLIRIGLVLISVQIFYSINMIFWSLLLVILIQVLLCYAYIPKQIKNDFKISKESVKSQIKSGWTLGIASTLGVLLYSTDGIMISSLLDVKSYAIYRNGAFQIPFISAIYGAISVVLLPELSTYFFEKRYHDIIKIKKKAMTNAAMLVIPPVIFFIVFGNQVIVLYLSETYKASAIIFMIYNLILLSRFTSYDELYIISNNANKMPIIYGTAFCINIVLNYILINSIGINGAAISSVISYYFLIIWLMKKGTTFINTSPIALFDINKLFTAFIISISISIVLLYLCNFLTLNLVSFCLIMTVYFIVVYHCILKAKLIDKSIITNLSDRLSSRINISLIINKYY